MRIVQEFYCHGCDGYFRVTLNMSLDIRVLMECPKCQRQHERHITNGVIKDCSKNRTTTVVVIPMPSTYSKTAVLGASEKLMRDGNVLRDPSRDLINDRWNELYGDRV